MKKSGTFRLVLAGIISGFLNGLFGSGGGVVSVMLLRGVIDDENKVHATSTAVIFMMSIVSFTFYALRGNVSYGEVWGFLPAGIVGAIIGALFLKKISSDTLKRIFGALLVVSGAVMLFRQR